ncbi:MAG: Uma2 family endonuclease [Hormoscilla sp.]
MTATIAPFIQTERTLHQWQPATWSDYLAACEDPTNERMRIFFHRDRILLIDMNEEGIENAIVGDLFTMLFYIWISQKPEQIFSSLGGCWLEKAPYSAGAPDLVLYLGEDYPRGQAGEKSPIDLHRWRVPDLVGEVSDRTLATDLDEKKQLYAEWKVPEYWVIDVRGERVICFLLQSDGKYREGDNSLALAGLPMSLLEQTLARVKQGHNGSAALWFSQQIAALADNYS